MFPNVTMKKKKRLAKNSATLDSEEVRYSIRVQKNIQVPICLQQVFLQSILPNQLSKIRETIYLGQPEKGVYLAAMDTYVIFRFDLPQ